MVAYVWICALCGGFSFATAVFIQYISGKLGKGKTKFETSLKLEDLERGVSRPFLIIGHDHLTIRPGQLTSNPSTSAPSIRPILP